MKTNKMMSMIVVLALLFSGMVMLNTTTNFELVGSAEATYVSLSKDGSGSQAKALFCGELITLEVNDNSLEPNEVYAIYVWNGKDDSIELADGTADEYGNIEIEFRVPTWDDLGVNPVTNNGTYDWNPNFDAAATGVPGYKGNLSNGEWYIYLLDEDENGVGNMHVIYIGNLFDVRVYINDEGDPIDHILHNSSYTAGDSTALTIRVYNWTEDGEELVKTNTNIVIKNPGFISIATGTTQNAGKWEIDLTQNELSFVCPSNNSENNYWVIASIDGVTYANISLPALLDFTATIPSTIVWGDEISLSGFVYDGQGKGISGYRLGVYAPANGEYVAIENENLVTMGTGRYTYVVQTGSDGIGNAGTWYLGTYRTTDPDTRVDMSDQAPFKDNFIPYHSFEVQTREDVTVGIEHTDDIITGFDSTINISVKKENWMENDEFKDMSVHLTGIKFTYGGETYASDDIVQLDPNDFEYWGVDNRERFCYYSWEGINFNESGTATVLVSHNGMGNSTQNLTLIASSDTANPVSGFYTSKYNNSGLLPNMTGIATFTVDPAGDMNFIITDMVERVELVDKNHPNEKYQNVSEEITINVYGQTQSDGMNATITIVGCGLDITIREDKPGNTPEVTAYPGSGANDGVYKVRISPKTGGTITVTVTNATEGKTISRDYPILGLTGSVTTSVGDDLKINVGTTETITATVTNGGYATVFFTFFNRNWGLEDALTDPIIGDGATQGEGLGGVFTFDPDEDDLEQRGYIVVAANAGNLWMYDIIEVEAIWDLEIELLEPSLQNLTPIITVGLEQDFRFRVLDPEGNIVTDIDAGKDTIIKLIDEDNDEDNPLLSWQPTKITGNIWRYQKLRPYWEGQLVIQAMNQTDGITHGGKMYLDVDYATFTYSPGYTTAGIGIDENIKVSFTGVDANGNTLPSGTKVYLNIEESNTIKPQAFNVITLDANGAGEFTITEVGDNQTTINITIGALNYENGNRTIGAFYIDFPTFDLNPDTIYLDQTNLVEVIATDREGNPIEDIYLTFNGFITYPEPVLTDEDGFAAFSINPAVSGRHNVTIIKELIWKAGTLDWKQMEDDNKMVVTDTVLTATSFRNMVISVPASVNEGESFTVTLTRRATTNPVVGALVTFNAETKTTGAQGTVTFDAPSVRTNLNYQITARATGYVDATATILVINLPQIYLSVPEDEVVAGERFEVIAGGDDGNNVGIRVTFNGVTRITSATGSVTFTAPAEEGTYTVTATKEGYQSAEPADVVVIGAGIPGFEVLTLIAALGVAFILLKKRRQH